MKLVTILVFAALVGGGVWSLTGAAAVAAGEKYVRQFSVGEVTVVPILDRASQMRAEQFQGPLAEEKKLALMPGGLAPASVNVFLLKGPFGQVLVDAGWGRSGPGENLFPERLKQAGSSAGDIDLVVLTHMHPDHIGGLLDGRAPAFPRARILVAGPEWAYWSGKVAEATAASAAEPADTSAGQWAQAVEESAAAPVEPENLAETSAPAAPADQPAEAAGPSAAAVDSQLVAPADLPAAAVDSQPVAPADLPAAVLAAYQGRVDTFGFNQEILPGLLAMAATGHTPGHTAFLLKSQGRQLLFIGDLIHAAALQFPEPEECASFDMDPVLAVETRRALLQMAALENIPIAGAHIPYTGLGRVRESGQGFAFTPIQEVSD